MAGFFALRPGADDKRWLLDVAPWLTVGPPETAFMFGGVGLGVTVEAAERSLGRAVVWATTQYLAYAPRGSTVPTAGKGRKPREPDAPLEPQPQA